MRNGFESIGSTSQRATLPREPTRRDFVNVALSVGLHFLGAAACPSAVQATALPFMPTRFETVDQVPKEYFDKHRFIYAFCERVVDGDTIRVRHIPGYNSVVGAFTGAADVQPLTSRGITDQTLIVRLYGVDAPEAAKPSNGNVGQPYAQDAKDCTSNLVYHQMVKVTFLKKDQYRRAVCQVETLPRYRFLSFLPGFGPRDVSVELAAAGLAELYTGGGAEYNVSRLSPQNPCGSYFAL
jgi:endonuclease YncB( thermonuclease family)